MTFILRFLAKQRFSLTAVQSSFGGPGIFVDRSRSPVLLKIGKRPDWTRLSSTRRWGGQFRKNEPPGWSGGGWGSGQCAGGGVYVSKMVDSKGKWLMYLVR